MSDTLPRGAVLGGLTTPLGRATFKIALGFFALGHPRKGKSMRKLILLSLLGATLIPATASAEVSPEKQAQLNAHGWTATDTFTVTPQVSEASDRYCERGKIRSAIRDYTGTPAVQGWTSIGACITYSGRMKIVGVGYGQGSSGNGWRRILPMRDPFLRHNWADWPRVYHSWAKMGWEYGEWNTPWYLHLDLKAIKTCCPVDIVYVRKARWS